MRTKFDICVLLTITSNVIIIKAQVLLPQTYVTIADFYPD